MTLWDSILTVLGAIFGPFPVMLLLFLLIVFLLATAFVAFDDGDILPGVIFLAGSVLAVLFFIAMIVFIGSNDFGLWSWTPEVL